MLSLANNCFMVEQGTQEAAAAPVIKRVKSENSLNANQSHTDSDGWEDLLASAPRAAVVKPPVASHSRGPSVEIAPR